MNKHPRILIVDDEQKIRNVLSSILNMKGYRTVSAESGQRALELVKQGDIDAVLLDIILPEMNGMEVLSALRRIEPAIPVIMITAYGTVTSAVQAIKIGAYDYIEKPLDAEKILITIKNAIERHRLSGEVARLRDTLLARYKMVGRSPTMRRVFKQIERLAPLDCTVIITGETGTGKELVARSLHHLSPRFGQPFIKINCAALPQELMESELFGHARGAFTGAHQEKRGKFEAAETGTLFLDEIGELTSSAQAKLLQAIEEKKFTRLGEVQERAVEARIVVATNKNLKEEVEAGHFRLDLYHRLNTVQIDVPPLREHREDIPELVSYYLPMMCEELNVPSKQISAEALALFLEYPWPGNVRELKHRLEEMLIYHRGEELDAGYVRQWLLESSAEGPPVGESVGETSLRAARQRFEREYIIKALIAHDWNIPATARYLGIERTNLYRKMKGLGIER